MDKNQIKINVYSNKKRKIQIKPMNPSPEYVWPWHRENHQQELYVEHGRNHHYSQATIPSSLTLASSDSASVLVAASRTLSLGNSYRCSTFQFFSQSNLSLLRGKSFRTFFLNFKRKRFQLLENHFHFRLRIISIVQENREEGWEFPGKIFVPASWISERVRNESV
jgi:hypothetical protein